MICSPRGSPGRAGRSAGSRPRRGARLRHRRARLAASALPAGAAPAADRARARRLLDELEQRTFRFFWETRQSGRRAWCPTAGRRRSFASVAAVGFALTAYPIGVERGWITREQARERVADDAALLLRARRRARPRRASPATRASSTTSSTCATGTALRAGRAVDRRHRAAARRRALLPELLRRRRPGGGRDPRRSPSALYARVDWRWAQVAAAAASRMGWHARERLHRLRLAGLQRGDARLPARARLADAPGRARGLGGLDAATYRWGSFHGQEHLGFAPLFGHQYSHVWIDFRGIRTSYMRAARASTTSRTRAAPRSRSAPTRSPIPAAGAATAPTSGGSPPATARSTSSSSSAAAERRFMDLRRRAASVAEVRRRRHHRADARPARRSPSRPRSSLPALAAMRERYGRAPLRALRLPRRLQPDASPSPTCRVQHGRVVPGVGWFDTDYLGIDQGPIAGDDREPPQRAGLAA